MGTTRHLWPHGPKPGTLGLELTSLPWEDTVKVTDGTSCGFPRPTRRYGMKRVEAAE